MVLSVVPLVNELLAHGLARSETAGNGLGELTSSDRAASAGKRTSDETSVHGERMTNSGRGERANESAQKTATSGAIVKRAALRRESPRVRDTHVSARRQLHSFSRKPLVLVPWAAPSRRQAKQGWQRQAARRMRPAMQPRLGEKRGRRESWVLAQTGLRGSQRRAEEARPRFSTPTSPNHSEARRRSETRSMRPQQGTMIRLLKERQQGQTQMTRTTLTSRSQALR